MIHPDVLRAIAGVFGLLVVATVLIAVLRRIRPGRDFTELVLRVRSWWVMVAVFAVALLLTRWVSLLFFAGLSVLAMREYLTLVSTRAADRRALFWAILAIPVQYLWIGIEWYAMFLIWIPVYAFLLVPMRMVLIGETAGFLRAAGTLHWGLVVTGFSLSHVAYLLVLPASGNPNGGGPALVLYLVFLTQFNDVAQYVWGKSVGRRKALPSVSPGKTLEGLLGGLATTTLLAWLLAPLLTPFDVREALAAGVLISLAGFVGDVVLSAVKRDLGAKDSGTMLPGHGGLLDRLDSLTYAAPLFFHFTKYLHF